jgi:hypothetical protein
MLDEFVRIIFLDIRYSSHAMVCKLQWTPALVVAFITPNQVAIAKNSTFPAVQYI